MSTGRNRELFEILAVDGHDLVPVGGEQHDAGVDDVSEARSGEELTCGSPERFVQAANVNARKCLREASLTRTPPPHLAEDTRMGEW